jgi:hypothetical protein
MQTTTRHVASCAGTCRAPHNGQSPQKLSHVSDLFTVDLITRYIRG